MAEKKLRPSSARRAPIDQIIDRIRLATHAGSRIVTYLPGSRALGFADATAFSIAVAEIRSYSSFSISFEACDDHPEPDASLVRTVSET